MNSDRQMGSSWVRSFLQYLRLDVPLVVGLGILMVISLVVLYSASGQNMEVVMRQVTRFGIGFVLMSILAWVGTRRLYLWAPLMYLVGTLLLIAVAFLGDVGKGAQRWLDLGVIRFQPSEIMKLAMPLMIAFYFSERRLPPTLGQVAIAFLLVAVPVLLIFKQPDLGTSILVAWSGLVVIFLAGMRWSLIFGAVVAVAGAVPLLWDQMHEYQRGRVLTFLNPESDSLGAGYHIIQSKIALGSGGVYGKGWLNGTQAHLQFLPERTTDFVFSVYGEEFGLFGILLLFAAYLFVVARGLMIAYNAKDTFGRLLAGSLVMTFFIYFFVNVGMVSGLLPVVGVPLPLVSYGGTSMVTLMMGFGMLMAIQGEQRLVSK